MRMGVVPVLVILAGRLEGQSLPLLHPVNPVAEARSGLYFQPLVPRGPGWHASIGVDYANMVEINFRQTLVDTAYLLDAEVLRLNLSTAHDLGPRAFVTGELFVGGSYDGFLDGFLNWYHHLLGIEMPEREGRPTNAYAYEYKFPSNQVVRFARQGAYLGDARVGIGYRLGEKAQSVLSLTLPTSTAGEGYARGTVSLSLLNTYRSVLAPRWVYEGSLNVGMTPRQGALHSLQKSTFVLATSGVRWRTLGTLWTFGNLYLHSPYYAGTGARQLDQWDVTIDFGWIIRDRGGHEFRFGMTEDLSPSGPAIDANFRLGYAW